MNGYDDEDDDFDELEQDELETKAARKKRLDRRRSDSGQATGGERPLRSVRQSRPRPKCLFYDPEYDEDDYDEMFD